jgi:hypothetical protein
MQGHHDPGDVHPFQLAITLAWVTDEDRGFDLGRYIDLLEAW